MRYLDMTQEEIIAAVNDDIGKRLTIEILTKFTLNDLSYKINANYRVYCFIKKSKEAMILNLRDKDGLGTFNMQLRIKDWSIFDRLDNYSENIRNAILLDSYACKAPFCSNDGSEYVFAYHGKEYRLCHMLCNNFWLKPSCEEDIESIIDIVNREIAFGWPKKVVNSIKQ